MNYTLLKTELDTDPLVRGYAGMTNEETATSLALVDRTISLETITGSAILNATDDAEFTALTDVNKDRWLAVCAVENINTANGVAKALEADIFGGGTTTRANLVAAKTQNVSRAVELELGQVRAGDVEYARSI